MTLLFKLLHFLGDHWLWITGAGLPIIAGIVLFILNPIAFWKLASSISGFIADLFRRVVEWFRKPHDWWRIFALTGAAVSAFLAVQWTGAEREAKIARAETIRVRTEYVVLLQSEKQAHLADVKAERLQCATVQAKANTRAQARISELEKINRDLEHKHSAEMQQIRDQYKRDLDHAKESGKAVTAGLRDGSLRLRDEWTGQGAGSDRQGGGSGAGAPGGSTAGTDDAADLRATTTGTLVQIVDTCDARVESLQSVIRSYLATQGAASNGRH